MRTDLPPQFETAPRRSKDRRNASGPCIKCPLPFPSLVLLAAAVALIATGALISTQLKAQSPSGQTPAPALASDPKTMPRHKRPSPAKMLVDPMPVVTMPVAPPVPETPNWPAYDKAGQASVVWDSRGLSIEATNSSLEQILKDVSTATGARVDGLTSDQRVFGTYGPGQARDVLSQLLQGSGFNVIMIGDQGAGAPRQILLSVRQAGGANPVARNNPSANEEDEAEEPPAPPDPGPSRPGFPPGAQPRTPQQIMQEMQQRQQQMQQSGQPGQPGQQPQQPPVNPQN